jgi:hypothetical protein
LAPKSGSGCIPFVNTALVHQQWGPLAETPYGQSEKYFQHLSTNENKLQKTDKKNKSNQVPARMGLRPFDILKQDIKINCSWM